MRGDISVYRSKTIVFCLWVSLFLLILPVSEKERKNFMKSKSSNVRFLCQCASIAAIYVVLTWISALMGLSSNAIQVRFSEMLCILPMFTKAAIPGLALGCLIANLLSGCVVLDIIFGSIATLLGAIGTYFFRKYKYFAFLPPIISNMAIIPGVLKFAYGINEAYWFLVVTVGIGEIVSIGILGFFLYRGLVKRNIF